ncbi:WD40-repeat-containing domain protein [Polychytrium aggregatum]|uniref:WD40-repeat-containing domain protein n=1 Tax=Polychytrium aggregatum TaxID=110093 RepID=UPI0022FEDFBD|nr:WD40-repeat-containing domain protein [Polychytrium aggregatum]KAI9209594.1 WD40-repeat-containing domain protein [Polychytrium aggregatum]
MSSVARYKAACAIAAPPKELRGHQQKVHSVAWNSIGTKLASGSVDKTVRIWSLDSRLNPSKDSVELKGHTGDVDQLCWDPTNADRLATASVDKTVRIWDMRLASSRAALVIPTVGENINICWSPDGRHIAVGNKDDVVSFIDVRGGSGTKKEYIWHRMNNDIEINEIRWNYANDLFFLTTGQGTIKVLGFPSFELVHSVNAHTANCYCLEFDPRGRYFATGSADAIVSLWDLEEYACLRTFSNLDWPVRTISFSHDGELLAFGSEDHIIDICHVETGEQIHTIASTAATNTVAWHPNRYILAYAGDEVDRNKQHEGNLRIFHMSSSSTSQSTS